MKIMQDMHEELTCTSHDTAMLVKQIEMVKDMERLDRNDIFNDTPWKATTGGSMTTPITGIILECMIQTG